MLVMQVTVATMGAWTGRASDCHTVTKYVQDFFLVQPLNNVLCAAYLLCALYTEYLERKATGPEEKKLRKGHVVQ